MGKLSLLALICLAINVNSAYYIRDNPYIIPASYNSVAQTGLIQLPTGQTQTEGTVGITVGNSSLNKFISVIATPFSWLETSFYYHRPRDSSNIKKGNYLDKGFNIKFAKSFKNLHIAVGFDDLAGTGFFSKEFIAATYDLNRLKITLGIGTGAFSEEHKYKNPIPGFENRVSYFQTSKNFGGEVDFNSLMKGPVGIFGGIEYSPSRLKGVTIKIENNPFNYGPDPNKFNSFLGGGNKTLKSAGLRAKEQNFNIGISYNLKNGYAVSLSQYKGNSYDLNFSKKFRFNSKRPAVKPTKIENYSKNNNPKLAFYENLLRNLEKDSLFVQSSSIKGDHLKVGLVNNKYNNPIDVFNHTNLVVNNLASMEDLQIKKLSVINMQSGIETGKISAATKSSLNPKVPGKTDFTEPNNDTNKHEFKPTLNFPELYLSIKPNFIYRYADPERFFAGGWDLMTTAEIKFSSNFYVNTSASYQIENSFERLIHKPDSPFLPHVRTDYVKYVQTRPDLYLNTMQLDYITKIQNFHYLKLTAGIFEMMFGGYGFEYLYKPFNSNLSIGVNIFSVKQRDFEQMFKFSEYETITGHTNLIYFHEKSGVTLDLGIGKYLAGDSGYTFDFSRKFKSGFKMGAYFTRTNISKEVFGEGSFDKGFYFEVPLISLFNRSQKSYSNITIQPLTRDGGAKLKTANPLFYSIFGGTASDYRYFKN